MNMCSRGFVLIVFVSNKSSEFQLGGGGGGWQEWYKY